MGLILVGIIIVENSFDVGFGLFVGGNALVALYCRWTGVIGGQGKGQFAVKAIEHLTKILGATHDVLPGIKWIADVQQLIVLGHDLHQPSGTLFGNRKGIEIRFSLDDRFYERCGDLVFLGGFLYQAVISIR